MAKTEYDWDIHNPPIIKPHSISKHETLKEYLIRFAKALSPSPAQERLNIDIIDGFSGGGLYQTESGELHLGSPLLILETLKEAEAILNCEREKDFKIVGKRIFIDPSPEANQQLRYYLDQFGYDYKTHNSNIQIIQNDFKSVLPSILQKYTANKQQRNKVIFLLDQYGYKHATITEIQQIFSTLGSRAEIILTFATDKLINFLSMDERIQKVIKSVRLEHVLTQEVIEEFRDASATYRKIHRIAIQYLIARDIIMQSGARWSNVLFIRSRESANGAYLYLHLSNNFRARDEMNSVIWETKNGFVQDAGSGTKMFEYDPINDVQSGFEFEFNCKDEEAVHQTLIEDLLKYLRNNTTLQKTFSSLLEEQIGTSTPAGRNHFAKALAELKDSQEINILTPKGRSRKESTNIDNEDIIKLSKQTRFYF
ncbi:three-Cys-motif partner protein TcmP [Hydrogenovibrio marinus]|uniref:GMT-like wHTH domain-containing protein n=1 Tax=Hydrogenovibrio marinus TaxID=28885 RepID=A0A066ZRR9_HYDMR|nr:three-Cys-motif partner protein TcmP [Hydrogenovibrio marinus]KDN96508.1 hypothetical protein EI16_09605 [Hydrogenovibrio marinus]BBN60293.1 hypothetical protein HVMH_1887 [Hydrogenovibrio marinus]